MISKSKLIIAGAGPGDPELISVKGLRAIESADVILFDSLVNSELLLHAKENCIKICVGKRAGKHIMDQEDINKLCVRYTKGFRNVLRLKGGDPFIFGRGYEELSYAKSKGISVEIVPGISSATSIAGINGIPLTCRGINHGFNVVTATGKDGQITDEIRFAAKFGLTTVILMGYKKLEQISQLYHSFGMEKIPSILISNGSLISEKKYLAPIGDLYTLIKDKNIELPSIIIVGHVVKLYESSKLKIEEYEHTISNISEVV